MTLNPDVVMLFGAVAVAGFASAMAAFTGTRRYRVIITVHPAARGAGTQAKLDEAAGMLREMLLEAVPA